MELPVSTHQTVLSILVTILVRSVVGVVALPSCDFFDTVRLDTADYWRDNVTGVIVHANVTYQPTQWDYYDRDNVNGLLTPVGLHERGCFCEAIGGVCLRMCCAFGQLLLPEKGCVPYDHGGFDVNIEVMTSDGRKINRLLSSFRQQMIVGQPCDEMYDDYGYEDVFKLYENGSIKLTYPQRDLEMWFHQHQLCLAVDGYQNATHLHVSKRICMSAVASHLSFKQWLLHHGRYWYIYSVIASVPCLVVSFCIFVTVRELRNMYGKLITIIVMGFIVTDVALLCRIYTTNMEPLVCNMLGYISYYAIMFDYFWGTVLCFDIWVIFSGRRDITESDRFVYYAVYACGMPVLLTGAVGVLDVLAMPNLDPEVRIFGCFLFVQGYSGLKYIYVPVAVILVFNIVCFVATVYEICKSYKESAISRSERPDDSLRAMIFYRLMLNMGLIWSIDVASWLVQKFDRENQVFFIISDIYNFGQGVIILVFCVCNQRTLKILKKNWTTWRNQKVAPMMTNLSSMPSSKSSNLQSDLSSENVSQIRY